MGIKCTYTILGGLFLAFLGLFPMSMAGQSTQTVYFDSGRAEWRGTSERSLQAVLRSMQHNPNQYLFIEGHTDKIGSNRSNDRLGWRRAFSVERYFLQHGIPVHRLRICSMGEILPAVKGKGPEVRRRNRRVYLHLLPMRTIAHVTARPPERSHLVQKPSSAPSVPKEVVETPKQVEAETKPNAEAPKEASKPKKNVAISLDSLRNEQPQYKGTRLTVQVVDAETLAPIEAVLMLKRQGGNSRVETDQDGVYPFSLGRGNTYDIRALAEGYKFEEKRTVVQEGESAFMRIELHPLRVGSKIPIPDLYFQGGTDTLLEKSFSSLDKIVEMLNQNPKVHVEIGGHINLPFAPKVAQGSEDHALSLGRAKAVYKHLVTNGISAERLSYKGYGNWEMLYPRAMSDSEKAQNRRVEVKVTRGGLQREHSIEESSTRPGQF